MESKRATISPKETINGTVTSSGSIDGNVSSRGDIGAGIQRAKYVGTKDYEALENKPSINTITLIGDLSFEALGLLPITTEMIDEIFDDEVIGG